MPNGDRLLAVTETPHSIELDKNTLNTIGQIKYHDELKFNICTAHPHYDLRANKMLNIGISLGRKNFYCVYYMDMQDYRRELLCKIPINQPGYQHSFSVTENYIILIHQPLLLNPSRLLWNAYFGGKSYYECYQWQPKHGTDFYIIEKNSGKTIRHLTSDAFFFLHTINSYEENNSVILDVHCYNDNEIINNLYLEKLKHGLKLPHLEIRRYKLSLNADNVDYTSINQEYMEFSRLNYKQFNGKNYRYFYAANSTASTEFFNQLIKFDHNHGDYKVWKQEGCYVGEPLFVAKPGATEEDAGVVLSIILNASQKCSFLIILDAKNFTELARVKVPHILPFGLHGNFTY